MTPEELTKLMNGPARFSRQDKCGMCGNTHFTVTFENVADGPPVLDGVSEIIRFTFKCTSCGVDAIKIASLIL